MLSALSNQGSHAALTQWVDLVLLLHPRGADLKGGRLESYYDGAIFSILLELLDDEYNPQRFQHALENPPTGDDDRPRNLHIIHMALKDFARRRCPKIEPLIRAINFQGLDRNPSRQGMAEVLAVFLDACVLFDGDNAPFVERIQQLDMGAQQVMFSIIQESQTKMDQDAEASEAEIRDDVSHGEQSQAAKPAAASLEDGDDLAQEAEVAHWRTAFEDMKRQAAGLRMRLDRIQENYDELISHHEKLQGENEDLQKQLESETGNYDKHRVQQRLRENETLISNLERQCEDLTEQRERLEKEKARLEVMAGKADTLSDENQELKSRVEDLSKKANMADNLRKKVEAFRPMEVELKALQNDKFDTLKAYQDLEKANVQISLFKQEASAYASKMEGYEIEIASFQDQKNMWKTENNQLRMRVHDLEQQSLRDEQTVKELQEKALDPSAVGEGAGAGVSSLADELQDSSAGSISMRDIEVQRLQAENALLRGSVGTEGEKGILLQEIEDSRASRQAIQEKYNELLEKYTVGQAQIDALILNMDKDGEEAYSNLRTQVLAEQNQSKEFRRQADALKQQLADAERDLTSARGDLTAVEKSSFEALEELKKTDATLAISLRAELDAERKKFKALKDESDNFQKQLLTAFIDKDQLRREAEEANHKLQAALDGQTPSSDFIKQGEKFEKLRVKAKELKELYEKSESKNRDLEKTLKAVRAGTEAGAQKAQADQKIKNLQRENAMIATAWYDLNSRLQSNHVVLQRRHDVPKSWLNKQRQMVNATPRR